MGEITSNKLEKKASLLTIASPLSGDVREGDSVAVNGACLTVLESSPIKFRLMAETLKKTNLGELRAGQPVNLERPVAAGEHFDGHFVMGHVDGVCKVVAIKKVGDDKIFMFRAPKKLLVYIIPKGSVALNGVSLTVVEIHKNEFTVSMMPYTLQHTTFGKTKIDDEINVEVDMIGKYVERYLDLRDSHSR